MISIVDFGNLHESLSDGFDESMCPWVNELGGVFSDANTCLPSPQAGSCSSGGRMEEIRRITLPTFKPDINAQACEHEERHARRIRIRNAANHSPPPARP